MHSAEEVWNLLLEISRMPWGPARSAQAATAVMWADALEGESELQIDAYLELALSYQEGSEEWKALAPLAVLSQKLKKNPSLFSAENIEKTARMYRDGVVSAARNPAISLEQIDELLDSLAQFICDQGFSMHSFHGARYTIAMNEGRLEEASSALATWRATPRDAMTCCASCDAIKQITEASVRKDWDRAVATAMPLFDEEGFCGAQPYGIRAYAMIPLLMSGRPETAWEAHVRSYPHHRGVAVTIQILGLHMEFLVRSGRWQRALEILRESIALTSQAANASVLMDYLQGAALTAREASKRGPEKEPFNALCTGQSQWYPGPRLEADTPLADVADALSRWALDVASVFDARNGNDYCTRSVQEVLDASTVDDEAEKRATDTWNFDVVRERESMPEPISTLEGETAPPLREARSSNNHNPTIDESDPYPPVCYELPAAPQSLQEAFDRYLARKCAIGFDLEGSLLVDWALCCKEDLSSVTYDATDHETLLVFVMFANMLTLFDKNYDFFQAIYEHSVQVFSEMDGNVPIVHPRLMSKLFGRSAPTMSRKDLYTAQLELFKYSCELDRLSWLGREITPELHRRAGEYCLEFTQRIQTLLPQLKGGCDNLFDLAIIENSLGTCTTILLECEKTEVAVQCTDLIEALGPACMRHGRDPQGLKKTTLTLRSQVALAAGDLREAARLADQTLRLEATCDPFSAFYSRMNICMASLGAGENAEALSQAQHLREIIFSAPLRALGLAASRTIIDAFAASNRLDEAIGIAEEQLASPKESQYGALCDDMLRVSLAEYYMQREYHLNAYETASKAVSGLLSYGNRPLAARAAEIASDAAVELDDRSRRIEAAQVALEIAQDMHDHTSVITMSRCKSQAYLAGQWQKGSKENTTQALAAIESGFSWLESTRDEISPQEFTYLHAGVEYDRGWTYFMANDPVTAIPLLRHAHELQQKAHDVEGYDIPLSALAECYDQIGDTDALRDLVAHIRQLAKPRHSASARLRQLADLIESDMLEEGESGE